MKNAIMAVLTLVNRIRETLLQHNQVDELTQRSLDMSIDIIRNARLLDDVISAIETNWLVYEILMEHSRVLHNQINILIKEKRKV